MTKTPPPIIIACLCTTSTQTGGHFSLRLLEAPRFELVSQDLIKLREAAGAKAARQGGVPRDAGLVLET